MSQLMGGGMTEYRWTCAHPRMSDIPSLASLLAYGWVIVGCHPAWKDLVLVRREHVTD